MNIVVTGAAGFIGSHTCERLVAAGHRVTGLDAFDGSLYPAEVKRANASQLATLPERFRLIEADICDRDAMAQVITADVDVVCHLAALAGVRPSLAEPLRYLRANIEDIDLGETIVKLTAQQNSLWAALGSIGRNSNDSLLNFLR